MRRSLFFIAMAFSFCAFAQNKTIINDKNAEVRTIKSFNAIKVENGIDVYLSYGDEAVAVSASEIKYRDKIKTSVEDGVLKIWYDKDITNQIIFTSKRDLRAYVSYRKLDMLSATSGSDILVDGIIRGNSLTMKISSGSDFKGAVDVDELIVDQSSGSDIRIKGRADKLTIEASSGSDFDGYDLITDYCQAKCSSGSDISITVNKELVAKASSGSDIKYKGNPTVDSDKSGGSSVSKRN